MAKIRKVGIPSGGTTGQVLKKTTGADYDTEWGTGGTGGSGDVVGPASSVDSRVVMFDGLTGKLIKDSGLTLSGNNTGDQDLSGKQDTLVSATNIKTINGTTILGSGDLVVSGGDMLLGTIQTVTAAKIFNSGALKLKDTTFDLIVASDSGTTVDRTLTLDVNNNDRRITIGGDTTLNGGTHNGFNTGDQTISNSNDSTSHTVTLSSSGGSLQLIEGANITLTTGGTGLVGTVTISASGGSSGLTQEQVEGLI